jgi:hypothetical protein
MRMISNVVARARRRLLWNAIAGEGVRAMISGIGVLILLLVFGTGLVGLRWIWAVPSIIFGAGAWLAYKRRPNVYEAAQRIDSTLHLVDTLSTAVFFWPTQSPRRCDEGMRTAQRERASEVAASVDLRKAIPLRIPRTLCVWAAALALLAVGLLTLRYQAGRLDLRAPLSAAIQRLFNDAKTELAKIEQKLETPREDRAELSQESADHKATGDSDGNVADSEHSDPGENASGEDKAEKAQRPESANEKSQKESRQQSADGGEQSPKESAENQGGSQQQANPSSSQDSAEQQGSSSSLFSKVSDMMANLVSALKPPSGNNQAKDTDRTPTSGSGKQQPEPGAGTRDSSQGSASRSAEQPARSDASSSGMSTNAQNADSRSEERPGSGAGREDGNKETQLAEQLQAMGKISVILGKRSKELSGTAYAEVASGPQQLVTSYEARKADHSDVRAKVDRDEIPLEFQDYVAEYFREIRKGSARATSSLKRH